MPKVGENLPKEASLAGLKRLKPMQQEFLNNYLHKDMTQTAAAREAGYKNPSVSAVRLLQNSVVQERLQEMRLEAQSKFGVTVDKSIRDLKKIRDEAWQAGKLSEAIRAEELRLKAAGTTDQQAACCEARCDSGDQGGNQSKTGGIPPVS